jgi:hypothetical protein
MNLVSFEPQTFKIEVQCLAPRSPSSCSVKCDILDLDLIMNEHSISGFLFQ